MSLSTVEAEHIAMSQALRNAIPLVNLMNELMPSLNIICIKTTMKSKVYEDKQSTIAVDKVLSMLPRSKHIGLKYYHFRQFLLNGLICIERVSTEEKVGDVFTKPLPPAALTYIRHKLMGW